MKEKEKNQQKSFSNKNFIGFYVKNCKRNAKFFWKMLAQPQNSCYNVGNPKRNCGEMESHRLWRLRYGFESRLFLSWRTSYGCVFFTQIFGVYKELSSPVENATGVDSSFFIICRWITDRTKIKKHRFPGALVPKTGVEPVRFWRRRILSPLRLPIPPFRHK